MVDEAVSRIWGVMEIQITGGGQVARALSAAAPAELTNFALAAAHWGLIASDAREVLYSADARVASWSDFAGPIGYGAAASGIVSGRPSVASISTRDWPAAAARPVYRGSDSSEMPRRPVDPPPNSRQAPQNVFLHLTT